MITIELWDGLFISFGQVIGVAVVGILIISLILLAAESIRGLRTLHNDAKNNSTLTTNAERSAEYVRYRPAEQNSDL